MSLSIPGFSAEACMSPAASQHWRGRRIYASPSGSQGLAPASIFWPFPGKGGCDPTCYCREFAGVIAEGCPCCSSMPVPTFPYPPKPSFPWLLSARRAASDRLRATRGRRR